MQRFEKRKCNAEKLIAYGFERQGEELCCCRPLLKGEMLLTLTVNGAGELRARVTDSADGEEYVLHRVAGAVGAFVGQIREEYERILTEIADTCYEPDVFSFGQTRELLRRVRELYGDEAEYLWPKSPKNAVWRRKENRKWYGALLSLSGEKLGLEGDEVEILDLRIPPEEVEKTVDHRRYFPGFHMNKRHWITVLLDGSVPTEEILRRIEVSRELALKKKGKEQ